MPLSTVCSYEVSPSRHFTYDEYAVKSLKTVLKSRSSSASFNWCDARGYDTEMSFGVRT